MNHAPIVLFVYCRPDHTRLTVDSLLKNSFADKSDLIIYSDAAGSEDRLSMVMEVRSYLKTINGFRSVSINYRPYNFGLSKSIIEGVSEVLQVHDKLIVLEDDMVTSPHFLSYMNAALELYQDDHQVACIHGYLYPVKGALPETFFLQGADCWGWGTWRRAWNLFNPDGRVLLDQLTRRRLIGSFDFNGTYPFSRMLKDQIRGRNDSWAIRWHASAFLAGKLTLYPGRNLVHNIGLDNSGVHCGYTDSLSNDLSAAPIYLQKLCMAPSAHAREMFQDYFSRNKLGAKERLVQAFRQITKKYLG